MKLLIVSDIHANWVALQAILAAEPDCENVLCLGDLVDYGPQPVMPRLGGRSSRKEDGSSREITTGLLAAMRLRAAPNPMCILRRSREHSLGASWAKRLWPF